MPLTQVDAIHRSLIYVNMADGLSAMNASTSRPWWSFSCHPPAPGTRCGGLAIAG